MNGNVQAFINHLNEREHVLLLIENAEVSIRFIENGNVISIAIYNGKIQLANDLNIERNIEISGSSTSLKELLEGRTMLRMLIKRGDLQVSAPFRTLLLLESLFYFGKTLNTY